MNKCSLISRLFLLLSLLLVHLSLLSAQATPPKQLILVVKGDIAPYSIAINGFETVLVESGIPIEMKTFRYTDKKKIIDTIKTLKPALVLTVGTAATRTISKHIKNIPVIFCMMVSVTRSGFTPVNIPGVVLEIKAEEELAKLKSIVPKLKKVGVIYNPKQNETFIKNAKIVAKKLGISLVTQAVTSPREIPKMGRFESKLDALWMITDNIVCKSVIVRRLMLSCLRAKIPVMGISKNFVKLSGALLAYTADYEDNGKQAGELAVKILNGADPSTLGILTPQKANLYLNSNVAARLGIKLSKKKIKEAKKVF